MALIRARIRVSGVVQGVGFRPFVFNLAEELGLDGWVLNDSGGVEIEVDGSRNAIQMFAAEIKDNHPPLARVEQFDVEWLEPAGFAGFEIRHSVAKAGAYQLVSPDVATCDDCLREVLDSNDRRYRYPFTNCTNCGPRFTIISDLPYDRPNTTMRSFPMCPECEREYGDPRDRRFHAQPNACPVCGPQLELIVGGADPRLVDSLPDQAIGDEIARTAQLLRDGAVVAIKGLGGYQLACDATNELAVATLRARKHRPHKPFALMMATLEDVCDYCYVSEQEASLMRSAGAPIVLLERRSANALSPIAESVAPDNRYLGVMLPYTPLHHILLRDIGHPLVMTSGNLTEEPIAALNDEAQQRLGPLCDALLVHNRGIYARYDDSVWFVADSTERRQHVSRPQVTRRARGYAPFPVQLGFETQPTFACGPELKNTFCLTRDAYAFVSQHIGDMANLETIEHYERTFEIYRQMFDIQPKLVAVDMHPGYAATRLGKRWARSHSLPLVEVQHHHAHIAACMVDNELGPQDGPVIGLAFDGTGLGTDDCIWGGEWLIGGLNGFRRAAHLEYLPLPGGDAATRAPWRIAVGYIQELLGNTDGLRFEGVADHEVDFVAQQVEHRLNSPMTSSMGRLFDAAAALAGVATVATYEAQLAIAFESAAGATMPEHVIPYPYGIENEAGEITVQLRPLLEALMQDVSKGIGIGLISQRFHAAIISMTGDICQDLRRGTGINTVALSGGCFQNRLLLEGVTAFLDSKGFEVLWHRTVPTNDGCISLGQAAMATVGMEN